MDSRAERAPEPSDAPFLAMLLDMPLTSNSPDEDLDEATTAPGSDR